MNESNENKLLVTLKGEVEKEISQMTLERGRKLLEDGGVLIFLGWDLNSTLVFGRFLHDIDAKPKLSPEGVTQVYMGSMYNPTEHSMLIWCLCPPHKKPMKVGETDPIVTVDLGVNVSKLNKAQI